MKAHVQRIWKNTSQLLILLISMLAAAAVCLCISDLFAQEAGELKREASWSIPSVVQVRESIMRMVQEKNVDELTLAKVDAFWADDTQATDQLLLLRKFVETVSIVFPETAPMCQRILAEQIDQKELDASMLEDQSLPQMVRDNLRLGLARALVKSSLYDEALVHLEVLEPQAVVDPATLLYFRAMCYRNLLDRDKCLESVDLLLENEQVIPSRYREVARLISADIEPLKADSLDEIARLMEDIRRRQRLYRSGTKVRKQEDDVIAKLDKMIEDLEKQAQQQQQQQGASGGTPSGQPMQDSTPGGITGPGNVDRKIQPDGGNWGDLPPQKRAAAMADLVKDLPPHYRQVIEEYFRKLARDEPQR